MPPSALPPPLTIPHMVVVVVVVVVVVQVVVVRVVVVVVVIGRHSEALSHGAHPTKPEFGCLRLSSWGGTKRRVTHVVDMYR
jgi:hypothetical protein